MNALQRDLKRLVTLAERQGEAGRAEDPTRLRFHLMPPVGWMNDPNGLCWYQENYHVFFQYGPFDPNGGVKFWGHWTSPDLLHWTQQPVFLCPDQPWDIHGVYSGSALVEEDELYLYYTGNVKYPGDYDYIYDGRGHNLALATTRDGIHPDSKRLLLENRDYPPEVSCHVRDPKVWKQDGKYYMVLGARTRQDQGELLIYESEDRLHWALCNTITTPQPFGYMWECPDIFCVDGQWIVMTSPQGLERQGNRYQNIYSCGYFPLYGDFRNAYTLGDYVESDLGFDYYAPQTFLAPDGRRIVLGWMGMPDANYGNPTASRSGWQHCMSVPRELHWNGKSLTALPVREMEQLRREEQPLRVSGELSLPTAQTAELVLRNQGERLILRIGEDAEILWQEGLLTLRFSPLAGAGRTERVAELPELRELRLLLDTTSLELFLNEGQQVMSSRFYPNGERILHISGQAEGALYRLEGMTFAWSDNGGGMK